MSNASLALVDTNLLVYAESVNSPFCLKSREALENFCTNTALCLAPQVLMELYATLTDPKKTNPAINSQETTRRIISLIESGSYKLVFPTAKSLSTVVLLLNKYSAKGQEIHDVNLAATMIDNGIDTIYTADTRIFKKLGLKAINPLT